MGKSAKQIVAEMKSKDKKYPYPSRYGSHASMVDATATAKLAEHGKVVLVDEHGTYVTDKSRLDDGTADPARHNRQRVSLDQMATPPIVTNS